MINNVKNNEKIVLKKILLLKSNSYALNKVDWIRDNKLAQIHFRTITENLMRKIDKSIE